MTISNPLPAIKKKKTALACLTLTLLMLMAPAASRIEAFPVRVAATPLQMIEAKFSQWMKIQEPIPVIARVKQNMLCLNISHGIQYYWNMLSNRKCGPDQLGEAMIAICRLDEILWKVLVHGSENQHFYVASGRIFHDMRAYILPALTRIGSRYLLSPLEMVNASSLNPMLNAALKSAKRGQKQPGVLCDFLSAVETFILVASDDLPEGSIQKQTLMHAYKTCTQSSHDLLYAAASTQHVSRAKINADCRSLFLAFVSSFRTSLRPLYKTSRYPIILQEVKILLTHW